MIPLKGRGQEVGNEVLVKKQVLQKEGESCPSVPGELAIIQEGVWERLEMENFRKGKEQNWFLKKSFFMHQTTINIILQFSAVQHLPNSADNNRFICIAAINNTAYLV
jgi:hypothetical protein